MNNYHCDKCEFLDDRSKDTFIDGFCKKYKQSLVFYDWFEKCDKCIIETLQDENAALRERLEKAVELKAKVGDTIYMPWVYGGISGIAVLEVLYMFMLTDKMEYNTDIESDDIAFTSLYNFGKFHDDDFGKVVFTTREAAEARLAELKGESK